MIYLFEVWKGRYIFFDKEKGQFFCDYSGGRHYSYVLSSCRVVAKL